MSLIRAGTPELLRSVELNDLALNTTLYYAADLSFIALDIGLSSALFGALTLLVILAVVFLSRKGLGHTFVRVLLSSALLLYGSAALYMAALVSHIVSVDRLVAKAQAGLLSEAFTATDVKAFESDVLKQSWMMTVAFIINVLIGDSIVWWRACAVWNNRVVYCTGPLLITLTVALGGKALLGVNHCLRSCRQPQLLFLADVFVDVSACLSLLVNLIATGLIAYKAWVHWRLLRKHLGCNRKSQVVTALALLVESGAIYCILLIFLIVYEASPALFAGPDIHQSTFLRVIADYTYACFIHIMAIYPVLIIVIVALRWSPIEQGFGTSVHVADSSRNGHSPAHLRSLSFDGATLNTIIMTDTSNVDGIPDGQDEVSQSEAKPSLVDTRLEAQCPE